MARAGEQLDVIYIGFVLGHGGDALQMLALAQGVAARGARTKIVVPSVPESVSLQERCAASGILCERTSLLTVGLDGPRQHVRAITRLFRSLDAPITHFHSGNSYLPRTAMLVLSALRYPRSFVTLQSPYETIVPGTSRARLWAAMASRQFHAVVSPSEHARRFQMRCGLPQEIAVTVRNSIDTEAMANGDPQVARAELGVSPDAPVVLFSSRMDGQKRPLDAVRAFSLVAHEFPTAVLAMLGGRGNEEAAVREEVAQLGLQERVRLVGYRTNVADWLAAATVWILPTERENFSVAVLEAMAAGCPVLTTMCPGNDEVLADEQNGLAFDIGDVSGAAERLRALLKDHDLRRRLSAGAKATGARYSVQAMVDQYVDLYRQHVDVPALA